MDLEYLMCNKHDDVKCPECGDDLEKTQDKCECGIKFLWFKGDEYSCKLCNKDVQQSRTDYGLSMS